MKSGRGDGVSRFHVAYIFLQGPREQICNICLDRSKGLGVYRKETDILFDTCIDNCVLITAQGEGNRLPCISLIKVPGPSRHGYLEL